MMAAVFLFAALLFQIQPNDEFEPSIQKTVEDSIHTEMILRSEDLIWESDWNFFSIDRMSFKVNSGYYGYYGPQPAYQLDGIPFDPTIFGMNYSQLLPVSFNQIQNINIDEGIGSKLGLNYHSGLIDFQSVPLKKGLSVFASGQFGHNSDEPGPWIFDENQVTPNVERFGPWADAGASLKFGDWYAKGLVRTHTYVNINPHVQTRIKSLLYNPEEGTFPNASATTNLGLVETGFKSDHVNLKVPGIRSESDDFVYFQPLAREIPSEFTTEQYSAVGSFYITDALGIQTMAQYRGKGTGYRTNQSGHYFDWNQTTKTGRASVFYKTDKFTFDIGSELRETEKKASGITRENQQFIDLFLDQQIEIASGFRFGTYSAIRLHDDQHPFRGKGYFEIDILPAWTTSFSGSYSEILPEMANPVDESFTRGYDIMNRLGIRTFVPLHIPNTKLYTLSHQHSVDISDAVQTEVGVEYLNHLNLNVPFQDAFYYLFFSTTPGAYFLFTDNSGQRLNLSFDAGINWSDTFNQEFRVNWSKTLEGDPAYKSYWGTIPEYLIRHSSVFTPYPDLEMRLNVQYQTETIWDEFRRLDGELNRTFHNQFPFRLFEFSNTVPAFVNIDLVLSKWFWEQRMRAVFMLSNLFNQKYRTHPIGSEEGFGYMLRLELRI